MAADLRPADDASIPADERLYIRIYPSVDALVAVGDGTFRPNSGATKGRNRYEPVSVDLGSVCTPEETQHRGTDGNFHVAIVTAGQLREIGLRVKRDPLQGVNPNPAHALVIGKKENENGDLSGGLTDGENRRFAGAARAILTVAPIELIEGGRR